MQDPSQGSWKTLCKWGQASAGDRELRGRSVRGQESPGGGPEPCLPEVTVVGCGQFALLPAVECEAWPGRYFGCTLSHPRPLELRPCTLHAITMTTTSNCFLAGGGRGALFRKGGSLGEMLPVTTALSKSGWGLGAGGGGGTLLPHIYSP